MEHLLQWLFFCDREISIFQFLFLEYLNEDPDHFTPREAYDLALIGTDTQRQMRVLKQRVNGEAIREDEIETNNTWVTMLLRYNGLTEFIITKFIEKFEKQSDLKKYDYVNEVQYSYFSLKDDEKIINPFARKLIEKIINKNAK